MFGHYYMMYYSLVFLLVQVDISLGMDTTDGGYGHLSEIKLSNTQNSFMPPKSTITTVPTVTQHELILSSSTSKFTTTQVAVGSTHSPIIKNPFKSLRVMIFVDGEDGKKRSVGTETKIDLQTPLDDNAIDKQDYLHLIKDIRIKAATEAEKAMNTERHRGFPSGSTIKTTDWTVRGYDVKLYYYMNGRETYRDVCLTLQDSGELTRLSGNDPILAPSDFEKITEANIKQVMCTDAIKRACPLVTKVIHKDGRPIWDRFWTPMPHLRPENFDYLHDLDNAKSLADYGIDGGIDSEKCVVAVVVNEKSAKSMKIYPAGKYSRDFRNCKNADKSDETVLIHEDEIDKAGCRGDLGRLEKEVFEKKIVEHLRATSSRHSKIERSDIHIKVRFRNEHWRYRDIWQLQDEEYFKPPRSSRMLQFEHVLEADSPLSPFAPDFEWTPGPFSNGFQGFVPVGGDFPRCVPVSGDYHFPLDDKWMSEFYNFPIDHEEFHEHQVVDATPENLLNSTVANPTGKSGLQLKRAAYLHQEDGVDWVKKFESFGVDIVYSVTGTIPVKIWYAEEKFTKILVPYDTATTLIMLVETILYEAKKDISNELPEEYFQHDVLDHVQIIGHYSNGSRAHDDDDEDDDDTIDLGKLNEIEMEPLLHLYNRRLPIVEFESKDGRSLLEDCEYLELSIPNKLKKPSLPWDEQFGFEQRMGGV